MRQTALTIVAPIRAEQPETKRADVKALGEMLDGYLEGYEASETSRRTADSERGPGAPLDAGQDRVGPSPGESDFRTLRKTYRDVEAELRALIDTETIHYMSVFFLDTKGGSSKYVGLEVNGDGSLRQLRNRLATVVPTFLQRLFDGCEDLDPECGRRGLEKFMARNTQRPNAYYVAFPGRSVRQIRKEQDLRERARKRFEQATHDGHAGPCSLAGSSPREAPSSASAMWEYIRRALSADDLAFAREGATRPFSVRWSLARDGLRDHVNLWSNRLFAFLLIATAAAWYVTSTMVHGFAPAAVAATFGLSALVVVVTWSGEQPRALNARGRLLIFSRALWNWLALGATWAAVFGATAMVARLGLRLAPSVPNFEAVVALAVAALATFMLALNKLGLRASVVGILFLLLVDLGSALPFEVLPSVLSATLAFIGFVLLLPAAAFFYVIDGAAVALVATLLLAAGWLALAVHFWSAPIELGALGLAGAIAVVIVDAARLARWLSAVRRAEEDENATAPKNAPVDLSHMDAVEEPEDRTLQNHLVVLSRLKEGPPADPELRIRTLRRVLRGVSLFAKIYANRGDLGGILTIHFAQFIILEKTTPKRLLFLSNFDGAFGAYLQEFNQVGGVTAVWSNCVGFPPAFGLWGDGAQNEQPFRQFGRRDQVPTLGWYSAYPRLFVADIETATNIREGLRRHLDDLSTWTGRMRARFGRPLSEADCDAALQKL